MTGAKSIKVTEEIGTTHLKLLQTEHTQLKDALLVKSDSPLINEAWYGSVSRKYRLKFLVPHSVPVTRRMRELNEFLLDGELPSGVTIREAHLLNIHSPERMRTGYICEICNSAYRIKENQYFQDGNHRTAILSIYEALADINIMLDVAPMRLYSIISNRFGRPHDEILDRLYHVVRKNHHATTMTFEKRLKNAIATKDIQFMNTQVENFHSQLITTSRQEARILLRACKRTNIRVFWGLKELHGLEQWS